MHKKLYTLILFATVLGSDIKSQNSLLIFDGVNDYVNLGSSAMTGVRTIELWFTPGVSITSTSLSDYSSLVVRNDATQNDECNLMFDPVSAGAYSGRLVFQRNVGGVYNYVASNSNSWNGGICYHVAAVIDPVSGMKMYINGVLQSDTNPYTGAPGIASEITTIGCFGDTFIRNFNGKIDEVRFWNVARSASEIAGAYQYSMGTSTSGLCGYWPFNEGSGTTTIDATVNTADGTLSGCTWATASASCLLIGVEEELVQNEIELSIFPNPINENSVVTIKNPKAAKYSVNVTDVSGKIIWNQTGLYEEQLSIGNLTKFEKGIYFLNVILNDRSASTAQPLIIE